MHTSCHPTLQHHNSYNRTENHRQWKAVGSPDDGRKDSRNMLRKNWLSINHHLLHLVGLAFIYLSKMHGYPNIKKKHIYCFPTAKVVKRTRLNVTLFVHRLCHSQFKLIARYVKLGHDHFHTRIAIHYLFSHNHWNFYILSKRQRRSIENSYKHPKPLHHTFTLHTFLRHPPPQGTYRQFLEHSHTVTCELIFILHLTTFQKATLPKFYKHFLPLSCVWCV